MEEIIFISHSQKDAYFARLLQKELKDAGFDTWMDSQISAGDNWMKKIDDTINRSSILLLVLSPNSSDSKYVNYEFAYAQGKGVNIIPLIIKKTKLHPKLEDIEYLDFTNPKNPPFKDLIVQIKRTLGFKSYENGWSCYKQGKIQEARIKFLECIQVFENIGEKLGVASSHESLGRIALAEKNLDESKREHLLALEIYDEIANDVGSKRVTESIKYIDDQRTKKIKGWIFKGLKCVVPLALYALSKSNPQDSNNEEAENFEK